MRNGKILNKKFFQFLLPAVLSSMAISLNEFVDSIVVANLIDSDAMSLVNIASPLLIAFAVIFTLLGVGGSTIYAGFLGSHEEEKADRAFSVTMFAGILISLAILVLGSLFSGSIAAWMCKAPEYRPMFLPYCRVLIISVIFIIPLQVIIHFLPALGRPGIGTLINVIANVINLLMDYVYIRFFSMGITGAAWATLTGYVAGFAAVFILCAAKKMRLPFSKISLRDTGLLAQAASVGIGPAANQIGYCIKIAFSNGLALSLAGMAGVTIFSVCMQAVSMVSVFISGVIDAMVPIGASLYGQRDFSGIRILLKTVTWIQFASNMAFFLFFELRPQGILALYNIQPDMAGLGTIGIRIFSIMFVFRGFTLIYMYYFPLIGRRTYAFLLSLVDGLIGIVPLAIILTKLFGINGLWMAYALLSILLLGAILAANFVISARSGGKYSRLLLLENEEEKIPVYDCTIHMDPQQISALAETIQNFCLQEKIEGPLSALTALSVEEMSMYTLEQSKGLGIDYLDMLMKIYPEYVLLDFRSIGRPFDVSAVPEEYSNMQVLREVVSSMEYNYVLGMNQTRLRVKAG